MDTNSDEYLNEYQAAAFIGMSPTLLKWFTKNAPKYGETVKLAHTVQNGIYMYKRSDLVAFDKYLKEPWPVPPSKERATIPEVIKHEVLMESGFSCALCPHMEDIEMAHVKPWAESKNNHPHNLFSACPNHHSRYDKDKEGRTALDLERIKRVKAELTERTIFKAKVLAEPVKESLRLTKWLKDRADALEAIEDESREVLSAVTKSLLEDLPLPDPATADPALRAVTEANNAAINKLREKALSANTTIRELADDIEEETDEYDEILDALEDEDCPHCRGRGQIGWNNLICEYCQGNARISKELAEEYDRSAIDFVECPACGGAGTVGLNSEICEYCTGDTGVTRKQAASYSPSKLSTVECPHCGGKGMTGLRNQPCIYCNGNQRVSREEAHDYKPEDLDETECPRCGGRGTIGFNGEPCDYCDGDMRISRSDADAFDPSDLDNEECPRCGGRGLRFNGDPCDLCKGDCLVDRELANRYRAKSREW